MIGFINNFSLQLDIFLFNTLNRYLLECILSKWLFVNNDLPHVTSQMDGYNKFHTLILEYLLYVNMHCNLYQIQYYDDFVNSWRAYLQTIYKNVVYHFCQNSDDKCDFILTVYYKYTDSRVIYFDLDFRSFNSICVSAEVFKQSIKSQKYPVNKSFRPYRIDFSEAPLLPGYNDDYLKRYHFHEMDDILNDFTSQVCNSENLEEGLRGFIDYFKTPMNPSNVIQSNLVLL